jgi:DNA replication and repair protein RecF
LVDALRIDMLRARGFRNLADLELSPSPRFNVFHGDNGQGKSNLLEAIDYLGSLRSFRGASAAEMIRRGRPLAELAASVRGAPAPQHLRVQLHTQGARELQVDGKRPRTRASYLSAIQTVLFHPGDLQLVAGAPELRRGWLDRILEHFDATYASTLAAYERALRSRNRLLRADAPDRGAVAAYHEVLAAAGAVIGQARERLVSELGTRVVNAFESVSGDQQRLGLRYEPRVEPELSGGAARSKAASTKISHAASPLKGHTPMIYRSCSTA